MTLADELRNLSKEFQSGADSLFKLDDAEFTPKAQAYAIIGAVKAGVYAMGARLADQVLDPSSTAMGKMAKMIRDNNALRMAAAGGKIDDYDRVVASIVGNALDAAGVPGASGGNGNQGGNGAS